MIFENLSNRRIASFWNWDQFPAKLPTCDFNQTQHSLNKSPPHLFWDINKTQAECLDGFLSPPFFLLTEITGSYRLSRVRQQHKHSVRGHLIYWKQMRRMQRRWTASAGLCDDFYSLVCDIRKSSGCRTHEKGVLLVLEKQRWGVKLTKLKDKVVKLTVESVSGNWKQCPTSLHCH